MLNDTNRWHTIIPIRKWQRNLLIFSSTAFILYLIVGFLIVPVIIEWLIKDFVETDLDRPLEIGSIGFNPLTFALSIDDFYLLEPDRRVFINWKKFTVDPNVLSLFDGVVEIDTMAVNDMGINIIRNQDSTFNFEDPVNHFLTLVVDSLGIGSEWGLCVNRLGIHSATAAFKDDLLAPHFIYDVDNAYFQLNDLHLFSQDTSTWQLNLHVRNGGMIEASGSLLTDRITSNFSFRAKDLVLTPFQPLLSKFVHLRIDSGTMDTYGNMHVELDSLYYPHVLNIAGTISNHNLSLYDLLNDKTFLSWDSLTTTGITADINPLQANIGDIKVRNLFARLAIAQDKSINVVDVFQPLIQLIETDSTILEILAPENIQLNIDRITIIDGKSSFSDLSLPLPFASRMHSLNGDLRNISWDNPQGARLNLEGSVDQYGYVAVRGTFDPFYPLARADLDVVFDNIELHNLTPYSVKFAGYKLEQGKMSLDLSYTIKYGQLQGSNQMLLNKITLGDEIESEDATGLPVKLAIALLKDPEGNIDLDVDVEGDLNDPQISMGPLVGQAFEKVVLNIVSSPFSFLGNLVGIRNGEEMKNIQFIPGRKELLPPQKQKLTNLNKVLTERPDIILKIYGAYDLVFDKKALQQEKFDTLYVSRLKVDSNSYPKEKIVQSEILEMLYKELFSDSTLVRLQNNYNIDEKAGVEEGDREVMRNPDRLGYLNALQQQLIAAQPITETELIQLAHERSQTIRKFLIGTADLAEKRFVIVEPDVLEKKDDEWIPCRLEIDAR